MRSRLKQGLTEEQVSAPGVWFLALRRSCNAAVPRVQQRARIDAEPS